MGHTASQSTLLMEMAPVCACASHVAQMIKGMAFLRVCGHLKADAPLHVAPYPLCPRTLGQHQLCRGGGGGLRGRPRHTLYLAPTLTQTQTELLSSLGPMPGHGGALHRFCTRKCQGAVCSETREPPCLCHRLLREGVLWGSFGHQPLVGGPECPCLFFSRKTPMAMSLKRFLFSICCFVALCVAV